LLVQNDLASDGAVFGYKGSGPGRTWWLRASDGSETQIVGLTAHNAINGSHLVVGTIGTGNPLDPVHAAMWDASTQTVTDLNSLLPASSGFILFDALAINDAGDVVGVAAHDNGDVGFLLKRSPLSATMTADPPDPIIGTTFALRLTVHNDATDAVADVTPPATLGTAGDGTATLKSGPDPAAVATLAPGASTTFTYVYEAKASGGITFTGDVAATHAGDAISATARCGLAGTSLHTRAVTGTCPANGNGAVVTIQPCKVKFQPTRETAGGNKLYDFAALTLTRLDGERYPPHGSGYPPGGT
jgi:hypothetical protein